MQVLLYVSSDKLGWSTTTWLITLGSATFLACVTQAALTWFYLVRSFAARTLRRGDSRPTVGTCAAMLRRCGAVGVRGT